MPPNIWHGTQEELIQFLGAIRSGCKDCGANRTLRNPCREHHVAAVLGSFGQAELDWLLGMRRAPFWSGPADRTEQRAFTPRK